jgi:hypothetical protein
VLAGAGVRSNSIASTSRLLKKAVLPSNANETLATGDGHLVPPRDRNFNRFRVESGAPIVVNWKSHPQHMDPEVSEWYERFQADNAAFPPGGPPPCCELEWLMNRYGVTHLAVPHGRRGPTRAGWSEPFCNEFATLYRRDPSTLPR